MAKEKVLSSVKKTSSAPTKTVAPAAPKVDESQKYKDAIAAIVEAHRRVSANTQDRNLRIAMNQAIVAAGQLI
jgi:hypothetical protein